MATAATRRENKTLFNEASENSTWLRPAFSWKAIKLRVAFYWTDSLSAQLQFPTATKHPSGCNASPRVCLYA